MDKRIGAQFYTIANFCQTIEHFEESCRKVREIGYKIVQLSGIGDFSGEEIKRVLDKFGLICACTHRHPNKYLEHLDEEIQFHKTIGCKVCGIGYMPGMNAQPETITDFVEKFGPVCKKLAEHGLIFAYHNHAFEFAKTNGKYTFDELLDRMPYDNFKLILDVYWLAYAGINPAKFIEEHKEQIVCLHYKDLKIVGRDGHAYAEVGQGNLDWDSVIAASETCSAEYALVEQDICDGDPFDSLKMSYEYLKEKGFE